MNSPIYKIKDSVDLFLSDDRYLMVYFINTRLRKSFKVNEWTVHLLETIDGKRKLSELQEIMLKEFDVNYEDTVSVIEVLEKNKIITQKKESNIILSKYDKERYNRQINYFSEFFSDEKEGELAQKRIMDANILIFGCGAVGGDIAIELAMAGVQNFTLYDFDLVESSDISRHIYYKHGTENTTKTETLKQRLLEIDRRVTVNCINDSLRPDGNVEEIISVMDFIINTLDEPYIGYTSSKISRICVKHNIPLYVAGGFDAHLASTGEIIIPYVTPCVECYASHFKHSLAGWKPEQHPILKRYKEIGGLASMSLFSASFACVEILIYLAKLMNMESVYKIRGELLFSTLELTYLKVEKNEHCPICGKKGVL